MSEDSFRDLLVITVERSRQPNLIVNSNGDTMPPQLGEVAEAQPNVEMLQSLPAGFDHVEIAVNLRADDSELYRIGNELDLSADAFRMFMGHLGKLEISAVFRIEKKTGVGTLIRVNGLDVDRPF
jgi:hypothetical protein